MNLCEASGLTAAAHSSPRKSSSPAATTRGEKVHQPREEFSVAADQALQNLSTQFSQFRNVLASRSTQLTEALRREERANTAVEDANARISKAIYGLKHDNEGLRGKAKILITQNELLRGELRSLQSRLQAAEAFASSGVEGTRSSEAAEMEAAEDPPAPHPPAPPTAEAVDNAASSAVTMSATDAAGTAAASSGGDSATQVETIAAPVVQAEDDEGSGYADAFTGGEDDGGSIVERPPPENEGPDDGTGDGEGYGPALLAVSSKRHRRGGRHGSAGRKRLRRRHATRHPAASPALPQIPPADSLPSTADGFAQLEKNSVASLQHRFDSQLQRLHAKHDELLQKQAALNSSRQSVEALHSRLAAAVTQLGARHSRLQRHARSVADFLERLAAVAHGPETKAAAALRALSTAPGGN